MKHLFGVQRKFLTIYVIRLNTMIMLSAVFMLSASWSLYFHTINLSNINAQTILDCVSTQIVKAVFLWDFLLGYHYYKSH